MFRMSTPSYTWTFGTLWVLNGLKPKAERYFPENKNISRQKLSVTIKRGANYNYEKWYIIVCVVCKRIKSWCSYFQFGETFFVNIYAFFFVRNRNFSERFFFSLLEIERSGLYTFTVVRKQNGLRTVLSDGGNSISSISMGVVPRETSENFVFFFSKSSDRQDVREHDEIYISNKSRRANDWRKNVRRTNNSFSRRVESKVI